MFHPMVAGVTIPGVGLGLLALAPLHRQEPVAQAQRPQVRDRALHDLHHDVGGARHHRLVLPGTWLQLRLPLERRHLLRAVGAERGIHRRRRRRGPGARGGRSSSRPRAVARRHGPAEPRDPSARREPLAASPSRRPATDVERDVDAAPTSPRGGAASPVPAGDRGVRPLRAGRRGRARRHPPAVLQPGDPHRPRARRRRLRRRGARVPLAVSGAGGFGGKVTVGTVDDIEKAIDDKSPFYNAVGEGLHPAVPEGRRDEGRRRCTPSTDRRRAWRRATSRCTRSARTSAAACRGARRRSGSSARATARSTTGSARSAAAPRPAAWTASCSTVSGSNIVVDTGTVDPGPADRHRHHRPGPRRRAVRLSDHVTTAASTQNRRPSDP